VEELSEVAKKNEGMSKTEMEAMLREERDETRERKDRELNVILHGAEECGAEVEGGAERIAWDRDGCLKLFNSLNLRLRDGDIKFCRRIGPKGEKPRPLVIGFYSLATRNSVLRTDLRSREPELSLGPDLTKRQREEETNMWKELEAKNNNRTTEERAKNLHWRLVGPKGDRRLILSSRGAEAGAGAGHGTGANAEPRQQRPPNTRGRGAAQRGTARGWGTARGGTARGGGTSGGGTSGGGTNGGGTSGGGRTSPAGAGTRLLEPLRDKQPFRPRISSKRTREENQEEEMDEEDGTQEPPTKH
jgi:uncharacterized membrane protein YgcG